MTAVQTDSRVPAQAGRAAELLPAPASPATAVPRRSSATDSVKAYVALTKPRIIELLLVTTLPTMILAHRGLPPLTLVLTTLVGGALAAGSANAFNCYLDRDIDAVMHRTANRPLAQGRITPRRALVFASALGAVALVELALLVNVVAAALTAAAMAFYVLGYTLLLKRRTPQNIVWGGAAGCMPVLIGWAAVTGSLDWAPVALFAVIFFWTPPHYWPLSIRFRDDYAGANVPMLPVVAPEATVARRIIGYSWAMVAASLAVWPLAGLGPVYATTAVVAGAWFLLEAHRLLARARRGLTGPALAPMRLFHGSITYLTVVFLAVAVDPLIGLAPWRLLG